MEQPSGSRGRFLNPIEQEEDALQPPGADDPQVSDVSEDGDSPGSCDGVESCLRFLVSNLGAGTIIGKGGSTISELQKQSGAGISVSRPRECFPGTNERVVSISGVVEAILSALRLILNKFFSVADSGDSEPQDSANGNQFKAIFPNSVCGAIIGKGGATVRHFINDSGASIRISPQDQRYGTSDRIVTITGGIKSQYRAVKLILHKVSREPSYSTYGTTPLAYPQAPVTYSEYQDYTPLIQTISPPPLIAPRRVYSNGPSAFPASTSSISITVSVPDEHVGAVVGKSGKIIQEIQSVSNALVRLSDRGDYVEGTNHRKITISGTIEAVLAAQHLITQKVNKHAESIHRKD